MGQFVERFTVQFASSKQKMGTNNKDTAICMHESINQMLVNAYECQNMKTNKSAQIHTENTEINKTKMPNNKYAKDSSHCRR